MNGVCFSAGFKPVSPSDSYISILTWSPGTTPAIISFFHQSAISWYWKVAEVVVRADGNAASLYFQPYHHLLFPLSSSPPLPESPLNAEFTEKKATHPKKTGQHPCTHMNLPLSFTCFMFTFIKLKESHYSLMTLDFQRMTYFLAGNSIKLDLELTLKLD